ncbi:MAG: transaldolase [Omnitrophica WOR_2 bacterium RIFCSPHIGHO2_01_FULL_48_9]|nr:MAG: transaldolase [Omnitrophica WOR_2 bacterium RIFCSPHIGHO2_01_FULL_48_9]
MSKTTLQQLSDLGQSAWLDYIDRPLLETGKLQKLIDQGLCGMTSNPSIFNQAISNSADYDKKILQGKEAGLSTFEIYDALTIKDIQDACDIFKPTFEATKRLDGYVSLEINPQIANDTEASIREGKRLFIRVDRPNVMIKVPATEAGFPVIEELIASEMNVNVTLIFSLEQYVKTVEAYFRGLKRLDDCDGDMDEVRSVASVFVSRVDTMIDKMLTDKNLQGRAAVANCQVINEKFKELFSGKEFKPLAQAGANIQRVLWGSTSTKNPEYSDIKYVTELITQNTVNTIPEPTLNAFLDHGKISEALTGDPAEAQKLFAELRGLNIDIDQVCAKLLEEGVVAFDKAFVSLSEAIQRKAEQLAAK